MAVGHPGVHAEDHAKPYARDLMRRLNRERGQTYVIVSHDPAIARSCHRIVHMESGRIVRVEAGEGRPLLLSQERRL